MRENEKLKLIADDERGEFSQAIKVSKGNFHKIICIITRSANKIYD